MNSIYLLFKDLLFFYNHHNSKYWLGLEVLAYFICLYVVFICMYMI